VVDGVTFHKGLCLNAECFEHLVCVRFVLWKGHSLFGGLCDGVAEWVQNLVSGRAGNRYLDPYFHLKP